VSDGRDWRAERGAFPSTAAPAGVDRASIGPDDLPKIDVRRAPGLETERPIAPGPSVAASAVRETRVDPNRVMAARNVTKAGGDPSAKADADAVAEPQAVEAILHDSERGRARVFYRVMLLLTVLVMLALPILPGPSWLRIQTAVASFLAAGVCVVMASRVGAGRPPLSENSTAASAAALSTLAIAIIFYLGIFSASATVLAVGIYFFGSSESRRVARLAYGTTASLYFLVTLGIAVGLVDDVGVFSSRGVGRASLGYRVVMEQAIFGMVFYLARSVRRANQAALERARERERELRMREAQLMEAKGELDRALRQGEGRLTGQLIGRFRLGDLLGRGGMGEVYAATDEADGKVVAVKMLHPAMLEDPANVQRFLREARATAAVPSEHVARVMEVGTLQSGVPFIVMELLEGHDLAFYLRRTPQLSLRQVVELVEHTARALVAVQQAGVVHRDLKPANIFLTDTLPRRWKVLDFGLSKLHGAEQITKDQAVGTPSYMAPEQIRGKDVDHKADLYALAAIAYRCITGRPPFMGDEVAKVLMDALTRMPESPRLFAQIPIEVELVLAIGLAKRRSERFSSADELARALQKAERGELDDVTRARGWAILKQYPWGERIRARAPDTAVRIQRG
jgi:serine/threonine-protein kinase